MGVTSGSSSATAGGVFPRLCGPNPPCSYLSGIYGITTAGPLGLGSRPQLGPCYQGLVSAGGGGIRTDGQRGGQKRTEGERETAKERGGHRERDRHTRREGDIGRETDKEIGERQAERQTRREGETGREGESDHRDRPVERKRHLDKERDRQTDRQRERGRDRQGPDNMSFCWRGELAVLQ